LPLAETDRVATGERVPFYQDWLAHNAPNDPFWRPVDFSSYVERVSAPVHLTGGWYDIFLPDTLADYTRLCQAGRQPYLTIGPWTHSALDLIATAVRESLGWFSAHLLGDTSHLRHTPVRVYVMGANTWREFDQWPPDGYTQTLWFLGPDRRLSLLPPPPCPPDIYHYDPADPTPAVGGASLSQNAGPKDNRHLEARPDVLTYTTPPLERPVEIIGPLRVELFVKSSQAFTDFFARLCDVFPSGRSTNLSDGLLRLTPGRVPACPDGSLKVSFDLWPTAHMFLPGHAIRLQVSSGAHPRYARNPGSAEPLASAVSLFPADQSVFHDPEHPSAIFLPVK
jgi:putative CocE/NonD family hydrolase